ncbi:MAG: hypothetical protein AB7I27_00060 [Bacteriovoracaceae bacterium]
MRLFILLICILVNGGCIKNKMQSKITLLKDSQEEKDVLIQCEEIKAIGNMKNTLSKIDQDTQMVITLVDENPVDHVEQIEKLANRIKNNSEKVILLSNEKWNIPNVESKIFWNISQNDLSKFIPRPQLRSAKIKTVYYLGEERLDLLSFIQIKELEDKLKIIYHNNSTLLDFCQLNRTLMIVLELELKTIIQPKTRIFNLYVGDH